MNVNNAESTFNRIYDSTSKSALALITAKCCNTEDISDIFQETYTELFLIISKKGEEYIKNPEALIKHIVKQKIYRHYSAAKRLKMQISTIQSDNDGNEFDISDSAIDELSIEENYILSEQIEEVRIFLKSKPLLTRKIFHLYYSLDKTIPEIAELLEIKQSTVKNHIYRTVKEVRDEFKQREKVRSYE